MEDIQVVIIKDGEALQPISMGEGHQSLHYENNLTFYSMGWAINADGIKAEYHYSIHLERTKVDED